jgi:hypothetical protein
MHLIYRIASQVVTHANQKANLFSSMVIPTQGFDVKLLIIKSPFSKTYKRDKNRRPELTLFALTAQPPLAVSETARL